MRGKTPWLGYAAAVILFAADRLLKNYALSLGAPTPALVQFALFRNTGIAFSIPLHDAIFWPVASATFLLLVAYFVASVRERPRRAAVVFAILLGAASNLLDRALYGATIDYLIFFGRSAVNIADGMIVGGLLLLLLGRHVDTSAAA